MGERYILCTTTDIISIIFFFVHTITNKLFSNEAGTQSKPKVLNHAAIHFNRFLKNSK